MLEEGCTRKKEEEVEPWEVYIETNRVELLDKQGFTDCCNLDRRGRGSLHDPAS